MEVFQIESLFHQRGKRYIKWSPGVFSAEVFRTYQGDIKRYRRLPNGSYYIVWKNTPADRYLVENAKKPSVRTKPYVHQVRPPALRLKKPSGIRAVTTDAYTGQRDPDFKERCNEVWCKVLQYFYIAGPFADHPPVEIHLDGADAKTTTALLQTGFERKNIHVINKHQETCDVLHQTLTEHTVYQGSFEEVLPTLTLHCDAAYLDTCGDADTAARLLKVFLQHGAKPYVFVAITFKTPRSTTHYSALRKHLANQAQKPTSQQKRPGVKQTSGKKQEKPQKIKNPPPLKPTVNHAFLHGSSHLTQVFHQQNYKVELVCSEISSPFCFLVFRAWKNTVCP
jgi:hypothetical protein